MKAMKAIKAMKSMKSIQVDANQTRTTTNAKEVKRINPIWKLKPGTILFPGHRLWKHALRAGGALL